MNKVQLFYQSTELFDYAKELGLIVADLELIQATPEAITSTASLCLMLDGLYLYTAEFKPFNLKKYYQEFIAKRQSSLHAELLIQALKIPPPSCGLDLSAGLGRDSIILSLFGYSVTMLENNPYLAIILNYLCHEFHAQLPKLQLYYQNNYDFLTQTSNNYNWIYFDPMFNDNSKALAKKDMQIIELLIKKTPTRNSIIDDVEVFKLAQQHCLAKLIIKRDNKQAYLSPALLPTYSKSGKTIRFDVYQTKLRKEV